MAISGEIIGALVEAISALNLRVDDVVSKQALQNAITQTSGDTEAKLDLIIESQIKSAAETWLRNNIVQPTDGTDGVDGLNGRAPTAKEIQVAVGIWFSINRASLVGEAGRDGVDGKDGLNGLNGQDGKDGANGIDGTNGRDGDGIALIEQRDDTSFYITLSNGEEFQIKLPKAKGSFGGGGGGGLRSVISSDGSLSVSIFDNAVDLTLAGGVTGTGAYVLSDSPRITGKIEFSGAAISAPSWTTAGIAIKQLPTTYTNTTSSGTVADIRFNNFAAQTMAASNVTTVTNLYGSFFANPVVGANVTATNIYGLGADSFRTNGIFAASSAVSLSATTATLNLGGSLTSGLWTAGGASGTGIMTLGRSTVTQTTDIQAGVTASGSTKTINLGTSGAAGSTTTITIGGTAGTSTTTLNGNTATPAGAAAMTNGFFYIPAAAGVPTGVPTAITGTVPMYYDTTNNKFYIYNGAWRSVGLV